MIIVKVICNETMTFTAMFNIRFWIGLIMASTFSSKCQRGKYTITEIFNKEVANTPHYGNQVNDARQKMVQDMSFNIESKFTQIYQINITINTQTYITTKLY